MTSRTIAGADLTADDAMAREKARLRRTFWPKFRRFAARLPFAEDLVAAYVCAFDRNTPRHVQVALVGALAYFVLPFDFIPDMMPLIGFTDDAAVLATAIRLVSSHITDDHRAAAHRLLAGGEGAQDTSAQDNDTSAQDKDTSAQEDTGTQGTAAHDRPA